MAAPRKTESPDKQKATAIHHLMSKVAEISRQFIKTVTLYSLTTLDFLSNNNKAKYFQLYEDVVRVSACFLEAVSALLNDTKPPFLVRTVIG